MKVYYMNGAGNDFAVIDARALELNLSALAKQACALTGADGFMAVDHSQIGDFKLHFYNADGSRGEMCGNGARCICRFAYDMGITPEKMTVETDAGLVHGQRLTESQYRVELNLPSVLDLNRKEGIAYVELGCPGVPHGVLRFPDLSWEQREQLRKFASGLRYDPAFPKGANINLYDWIDGNTVRILTYERGVEDYTLACGTGSASVAAVLWQEGKLPSDGKLTVVNPGGTLIVTVSGKDVITQITLEGPTEKAGEYEI